MACDDAAPQKLGRRFALILGNGAYTQKAPLSKTVATALEMQRKLIAMGFHVVCGIDKDLCGMRTTTLQWLQIVSAAADAIDVAQPADKDALLLMFVYCGHGSADRLFPIDVCKKPAHEDVFCFFEDFLFRLYDVLSFNVQLRRDLPHTRRPGQLGNENPVWEWRQWPAQVVSIIESCRRLSKEEQHAYESQKARIANGRRHLLPCMASLRPDLAPMGGADWDAARLSFLAQLGPNSPQMLLALSSESSTPSYDVVYLRSIVEQIDRPVKLVGILERASQDTLRKTGHKQRPVLLLLCDPADDASKQRAAKLQDMIISPLAVGSALTLRRNNSSACILDGQSGRLPLGKGYHARCSNSQTRRSLPVLI